MNLDEREQLLADVEAFCQEIRPEEEFCYVERKSNEQVIPLAIKHHLLGMLTPSSNTTLEPVTAAMIAGIPEASAHFGRFRVTEIGARFCAAAMSPWVWMPPITTTQPTSDPDTSRLILELIVTSRYSTLPLSDREDVFQPANDDDAVRNGRRRHDDLAHGVGREQLEGGPGLDDEDVAVFARGVELPIRGDG